VSCDAQLLTRVRVQMPPAAKLGIVMQYLPNESLHELLASTRTMDLQKALRVHKRQGRYLLPGSCEGHDHPLLHAFLPHSSDRGAASSAVSPLLWDLVKFPFDSSALDSCIKPPLASDMVREGARG